MRLINARTLQLEEFVGEDNIPPYYILSHRWTNDEITFKDFVKGRRKDSLGYKKIVDCCEFVLRRHDKIYDIGPAAPNQPPRFYVWIDTCCIDKKSSAELSEAINSMYAYYRDSGLCIVYLSDVSAEPSDFSSRSAPRPSPNLTKQIANSSWFTRGWTLQELIAPKQVVFLDSQWRVVGSKGRFQSISDAQASDRQFSSHYYTEAPSLENTISKITDIPVDHLYNPSLLSTATIAQRMSWAAHRTTLRIEDMAYCLLGLFDVNLPLLYGEGPKAFLRLQEELIRRSNDQSVFAWWPPAKELERFDARYEYFKTGIFAPSPSYFEHSAGVIPLRTNKAIDSYTQPYAMTNSGLELWESIRRVRLDGIENDVVYTMRLKCAREQDWKTDPIQIAFWKAAEGYVRLVGRREGIAEEALDGDEVGEGDEEEKEQVLYIRPVGRLTPILTKKSSPSNPFIFPQRR